MAKPIWFTAVGDFQVINAAHSEDFNAIVPVTGSITFTPMLANGDVIRATGAEPRPTGIVPIPVTGVIDGDGRVRLKPQARYGRADDDEAGVRLMADSPLLELDTPLFYKVSFSNIRFGQASGSITPFAFQAPGIDGAVLNLISVLRVPGQTAAGVVVGPPGPPGPPGTLEDIDITELLALIGPVTGIKGDKGDPGDPGKDGKDGSQWFFGEGPPGTLLGSKPGDVYLDSLTGIIYQLGDSPIK